MLEMFNNGDYEALDKYIEITSSKSTEHQIEGLVYRSRMMAMMDRWQEGLDFAEQAIEISGNNKLDLLEIRSLIAKGYSCSPAHHAKLTSTFANLDMLIESSGSTIPGRIMNQINGDIHFLKGWFYFNNGQSEIGWEALEKALAIRRASENKAALCEVLLYYGFTFIEGSVSPERSLEYLEEGVKLAEDLGNRHLLGLAYNWYGAGISVLKDASEGLLFYEKGIAVYKELGEEAEVKLSRIYNNLAIVYKNLEEFDKSLENHKLQLSIVERTDDLAGLGFAHNNLSWTYFLLNNFEKAIFHRKKSLDIAYQINQKSFIPAYHYAMGWLYFTKGDINLAEKEFLLVERLRKELGDVGTLVWAWLSLLSVYTLKMQTDKAFEKIKQILLALADRKAYIQFGFLYLNEGINHRTTGNIGQAKISFQRASEYWTKIPDTGDIHTTYRTSSILFQKILLMHEVDDYNKGRQYFEELKLVTNNSKSPNIILRRKFLEGIILKTSERVSEKFQAQRIFQEIVADKIFDLQIYSLSMLNLCDLLILEMKITTKPEARLKEIILLVGRMTELGKSQDILNLVVMGEFIQGKIELVYNDLEAARVSFEEAKTIAEKHNLNYLISKVQVEQDFVDKEISRWKEMSILDLTLSERVEKAQIHAYLTHAISVKEKMVNSGSITS